MKDKAVIAVLAAVLIVAAAVGGIFIKNQMKSSDSTGKQTTSMNIVDKTPLQRQSDEVLDKIGILATQEHRSVTNYIEFVLLQYLETNASSSEQQKTNPSRTR